MDTILLSHALYRPGMEQLEGRANLIIPNDGDSARILPQLREADGFILRIGRIDRQTIEACPRLRVITRPGVGVDNVDVAAATEHGIPVVICPANNARAVAEHTLTLLLSISKNLLQSCEETRKGNFAVRNQYAAVDVEGKRLAVLGAGQIGKRLAAMCAALDMRVTLYDPFVTREAVRALNPAYDYAETLEDALASADYVSLHMPSLPSTRGILGEAQLRAMKPTAFLINCARGDLVNESALCAALREGHIAGAALDVLSAEPMPADHPLLALPNVIVTPHMAAQTQETTARAVIMAAVGTLAVLAGEEWPDVCNPDVYATPQWQARKAR